MLNNAGYLRDCLEQAAKLAGMHIVGQIFHPFSPHGVTGVLLLAESHMAIHTWPERGYAALDIFACGGEPHIALDLLCERLHAVRVEVRRLERAGSEP